MVYMCRFVGHYMSSVNKSVRRAVPFFTPVLNERRASMKEYGDDWPDKPVSSRVRCPSTSCSTSYCPCTKNDALQWVLDIAVPKGYSDVSVVDRLLFINSGAIHTTSNVRASSVSISSLRFNWD